ncbi:hypothetical protein EV122DRAFT_283609 [Schizophyllum commune]
MPALDTVQSPTCHSLPSSQPWGLIRRVDSYLLGPPDESIYVLASAESEFNVEAAPTLIHPHLLRRFEQQGGNRLTRFGRRLVELHVGSGQRDAYLAAVSHVTNPETLLIFQGRPLSAEPPSLERVAKVAWVAHNLENRVILCMALREIGSCLRADPRAEERYDATPFGLREIRLRVLPAIIDAALLIEHTQAIWLRPSMLIWLFRLRSAGVDLTKPVGQPGSSREISIPASYLSQLAYASTDGADALQDAVLNRVARLTEAVHPPQYACTKTLACASVHLAFVATLKENPDLLGVEPIRETDVRKSGRCFECRRQLLATDSLWGELYLNTVPKIFGLGMSQGALRRAQARYEETCT